MTLIHLSGPRGKARFIHLGTWIAMLLLAVLFSGDEHNPAEVVIVTVTVDKAKGNVRLVPSESGVTVMLER